MSSAKIKQIIPALAVSEGAGVTVHRTLGTPALRHLDPFLMLDHFGADDPDEYIAGFPDHPHRGFITLTYMLDGHMLHQDSMGNRGDLRSGGIQWMKAASGVIHSEMPQQTNGLMRGFQLWINLPAKEKMSDPAYQDYAADRIPTVNDQGMQIKVISGTYQGARGPLRDPHTELLYLDVHVPADTSFGCPLQDGLQAFAYTYEGDGRVADTRVAAHQLIVFDRGPECLLTAGNRGMRFILVAGKPIGEPIVQYGPFVMNTEQEIRQAFDDYKNGRLVRKAAAVPF